MPRLRIDFDLGTAHTERDGKCFLLLNLEFDRFSADGERVIMKDRSDMTPIWLPYLKSSWREAMSCYPAHGDHPDADAISTPHHITSLAV